MKKPLLDASSQRIVLGKVGAVHGVKGFVTIHSDTSPPENILNYQPWQLKRRADWAPITVTAKRVMGRKIVVQFNDCDDRELAKQYTNAEISVERGQLPDLPDGDYYWTDLEGLAVQTLVGTPLGVVDYILPTGANDVLVTKGETTTLIPFIQPNIVTKIDLENALITVDWEVDDET